MLRFKIDVLAALKENGYTQHRIRKERLLGVSVLSKIREGGMLSPHELDVVCRLLNCQPGDIIERISDETDQQQPAHDE